MFLFIEQRRERERARERERKRERERERERETVITTLELVVFLNVLVFSLVTNNQR